MKSLPSNSAPFPSNGRSRGHYAGPLTGFTGVILAAFLAACGSGGDEVASTTTAAPTTTEADIQATVTLTTHDGLIGGNVDDVSCTWGTVRFEIRDPNASEVLGVGDQAVNGNVISGPPNYECQASIDLHVPPVDFYEVTVSGSDELGVDWSASGTFSQTEMVGGVELEA